MENTEINYASKYSTEIDERFALSSVTEKAVNQNYEFDGVNKVFVYSADTAEVNDYSMSGSNRYGTPVELGNRVQELALTQDKSFTFTIDRRNNDDTMMTQHAGRCLQRQIDEVIIPMMDKYRLAKLAEAATIMYNNVTANWDVYTRILQAGAELTEKKVPRQGRIIFMTPYAHMQLKLAENYKGWGDTAAQIAQSGSAELIDGMEVVVIPSDYLPDKAICLITHPCAMCSPVKLAEYNVHENPPGISGWLVEGRTYYDAFVMNNKKHAIALLSSAEPPTDTAESDTEEPSTDSQTTE